MKGLVNHMLTGTFGSMRRIFEARESGRREAARVTEALERVVEGTDPAIRYVRGYRKKLHEAIAGALDYTDRVIAEIPGAVGVSRATFVADPYVNAFFVNVQDLQSVFSHSSELREFIDVHRGAQPPVCYALLCMRKTEKTVLGIELEGDVLKHDVWQTAVSFSDHRIYSPAPTEADARLGLKQCLFDGLGTSALGRIMDLKLSNHRLQEERQRLKARLRRLEQRMRDKGGHQPMDAGLAARRLEVMRQLDLIEKTLLNSRLVAPEESLNQVYAVFKRPDNFIRLQKSTLRLNKMGIRIEGPSTQPCNELHLTEAIIGEEPPRVVTLAKFPADEVPPPPDFMAHYSVF
jgi:hypothetical protein